MARKRRYRKNKKHGRNVRRRRRTQTTMFNMAGFKNHTIVAPRYFTALSQTLNCRFSTAALTSNRFVMLGLPERLYDSNVTAYDLGSRGGTVIPPLTGGQVLTSLALEGYPILQNFYNYYRIHKIKVRLTCNTDISASSIIFGIAPQSNLDTAAYIGAPWTNPFSAPYMKTKVANSGSGMKDNTIKLSVSPNVILGYSKLQYKVGTAFVGPGPAEAVTFVVMFAIADGLINANGSIMFEIQFIYEIEFTQPDLMQRDF